LESGHYETLITQQLRSQLATLETAVYAVAERKLKADDAAMFITRYLAQLLSRVLGQLAKNEDVTQQLTLANEVIAYLQERSNVLATGSSLAPEGQLLRAVLPRLQLPLTAQTDLDKHLDGMEPALRFSQSDLFSGGNSELSLEAELKKEIATADRIDFIVSFVKWSGLRLLLPSLQAFAEQGKPLRLLTTTYMGATDQKAVDALAALPGAQLRISYNTAHERLHAKAYLFSRNSGFDTAYIGSSNMSRSALTSGLEWNVKVTAQDNVAILSKFRGTFETYWNSPEFELYASLPEQRQKLALALRHETSGTEPEILPNFRLRPFPYQQEILDRLAVERSLRGYFRNLVVAATGTGKTVVSAFDYARFATSLTGLPRLLFVAHREEILRQARATFRHILGEANFGELWVGDEQPLHYEHLFVSVQTFASQLAFFEQTIPRDYYQYLVIDEVHHLAAASYRPILAWFQPTILLGLTATPERADGESILPDFDNTIAAEIRLPEAIARGLLVPFQYFCITDPVDYRHVRWTNGRYSAEDLTNEYTGNDVRVSAIIGALHRYLLAPHQARALSFCASREHARVMAEKFQQAGLRAAYLASGTTTAEQRRAAVAQLKRGELNYLFVVDLFNEGVDIPEVDTLLFLRPTESLTVFLQQLGRGLRLHDSKECLTVLDFVGQARQEYSYEQRFRALVGRTGVSVLSEAEDGFPRLPAGCSIQMEREAMKFILANIRAATGENVRVLERRLRGFGLESSLPLTLSTFLDHTHFSLVDIYRSRGDRGWTALKVRAGVLTPPDLTEQERVLVGSVWRLAQLNGPAFLVFIRRVFDPNEDLAQLLGLPLALEMGLMLHYILYQKSGPKLGFKSMADSLEALRTMPTLKAEVLEVLTVCEEQISIPPVALSLLYPCALQLHSRYSRDEILCAFGVWTFERNPPVQAGVFDIPALKTELLFVTLEKSSRDFSPTTLYQDYAISDTLFHWESQNSTAEDTPKGISYVQHQAQGKTILLFVREHNQDAAGLTMPYVFLGPVQYLSHKGNRPMAIIWRLETPLPGFLWHEAGKMAVG
jgi:superfamily II DNA or RNA helicase/HKD family nuclease